VPKVDALTVAGLELWFNSNDHRPPHFHAEKSGEWAVRIKFLESPDEMVEVIYSAKRNRPSRSDLKELTELAAANRVALLEEWETKVIS
jgi:hypothetical protein